MITLRAEDRKTLVILCSDAIGEARLLTSVRPSSAIKNREHNVGTRSSMITKKHWEGGSSRYKEF
jgi:hypothetical protein